jgi:hypothetical protein
VEYWTGITPMNDCERIERLLQEIDKFERKASGWAASRREPFIKYAERELDAIGVEALKGVDQLEHRIVATIASLADISSDNLEKVTIQNELKAMKAGTAQLRQDMSATSASVTKAQGLSRNNRAGLGLTFLLDLLLPPAAAEAHYMALEDVFESRWLPRYGWSLARFVYCFHAVAIVVHHHSKRIVAVASWFGWPSS